MVRMAYLNQYGLSDIKVVIPPISACKTYLIPGDAPSDKKISSGFTRLSDRDNPSLSQIKSQTVSLMTESPVYVYYILALKAL